LKANSHEVKVGNFHFSITDPSPTQAAALFELLTDRIISRELQAPNTAYRPDDPLITIQRIRNPRALWQRTNQIARHCDPRVAAKRISFPDVAGVNLSTLAKPHRSVMFRDRQQLASFTDGHADYSRELSLFFVVQTGRYAGQTRYAISRSEDAQDQPAILTLHQSGLDEMDAQERAPIGSATLSEELEIQCIKLMASAVEIDFVPIEQAYKERQT
jgi:hypothetical protein